MIARLYRYAGRYFDREFGKYGFGSGTSAFLVTLYHQDGISQSRLSAILHTDKANTARAVSKLERLGYIERRHDEHDARMQILFITTKAKAIKEDVFSILRSWTEVITDGMADETETTARLLLGDMIVNAAGHFNETTEIEP